MSTIEDEESCDIELGDCDMQSHIKVRDYKMSFQEFIELSQTSNFDSQKWYVLMSLLGCCNAVAQNGADNTDLIDKAELHAQYQEQIRLIQDFSTGILECKRKGAGALLMLEIVNSISIGIGFIFDQFYSRLKLKSPLQLSQLATRIRKLVDQDKSKQLKGFGAKQNVAKSFDALYMLLHPVLSEEHFPHFLGLLTDSSFVFDFMIDGFVKETEYMATVDGFVTESNGLPTISYYVRDERDFIDSSLIGDSKAIFDYANSQGIKPFRTSNDSFESYIVNLQYFLDNILPLYLNSQLVSKRYRLVTEKVEKSFLGHCHNDLQESICALIVNKFDDFLVHNTDEELFSEVVLRVKSKKLASIKSLGKLLDLPINWTKLLTPQNLKMVLDDFVDLVDYLQEDNSIIEQEDTEEVEEVEQEMLTVDDINIINSELSNVQTFTTQLVRNENIEIDSDLVYQLSNLRLNSVCRFMDKIHELINSLASYDSLRLNIPSILQYATHPNLFDGQRFISPKRLTIFTENEKGFCKGDLEFRVGSALRLFLRMVDGKLNVVYFGNPDYH